MNMKCPVCDQFFKPGEILRVTVFAPWVPIPSKISYCIGKPIDVDQNSIEHQDCFDNEEDAHER